jgi:hypothetical protein
MLARGDVRKCGAELSPPRLSSGTGATLPLARSVLSPYPLGLSGAYCKR